MGTQRIGALALLGAIGLAATGCGADTAGTQSAKERPGTSTSASTSRAPFDGEELTGGEVVQTTKLDGAHLESSDDGRLRNYGVAVDVLDFGTADVVDSGEGTSYGAADDATLLAFRLRVTPSPRTPGRRSPRRCPSTGASAACPTSSTR